MVRNGIRIVRSNSRTQGVSVTLYVVPSILDHALVHDVHRVVVDSLGESILVWRRNLLSTPAPKMDFNTLVVPGVKKLC